MAVFKERVKIIVTILAGCVFGAAVAGIVVHTRGQKAQRTLTKDLNAETDKLLEDKDKSHKATLAELRLNMKQQGVPGATVEKIFETREVPVATAMLRKPEVIMAELIALGDRKGRDRTQMMRLLIRNVEYLVDHGEAAFPEIKKFLERQEEVDYGHNVSGDWRSGRISSDFLVPPTLRFALFNACRRIGTDQALQILAKEIETTGRAVELAYLAASLEELAPTQYKVQVLAATHELLDLPPTEGANQQSRLDKGERTWLYGILRKYKDETYASKAEEQLIVKKTDEKGNERVYLDRAVMGYLTEVLGERAMPMLARIYNDPNVPDSAKGDIRRTAASNVGRSTDAENIVRARFTEGINLLAKTEDRRSVGRGNELVNYYLSSLASSRNVDESSINSRRKFLSTLRGATQDAKVLAKMDKVEQRLQDMLDPEKAKKLGRFSLEDRNRR